MSANRPLNIPAEESNNQEHDIRGSETYEVQYGR